MKTIEFKETELKEGDKKLNYGHLIHFCLDRMPKEGWTASAMRERMDIQDKLNADNNKRVDFIDTEVQVIKNCVQNFPWSNKHRNLIEFDEYIKLL